MDSHESEERSRSMKPGLHLKLKERLGKNLPVSLSFVANLDEAELVGHLREKGIAIDRDVLAEWTSDLGSGAELVSRLMEQGTLNADLDNAKLEWVWAVITVLWDKWLPHSPPFEIIDYRIGVGSDRPELEDRCEEWLEVWPAFMSLANKLEIQTLEEADDRFRSDSSIYNWAQDLEMELGDLARSTQDPAWHRRRVDYCGELLERFPNQDNLLIQNMRRAWGESLFAAGETERAEEHFREWLEADPHWSWGWIAWAECYLYGAGELKDLNRAEELLQQGLNVPGIPDRDAFYERLEYLGQHLGRESAAAEMRDSIKRLRFPTPVKRTGPKVGRNDPCPCGSGKKFKKCCGG